ncbi:HAD-IIB family hydrolase [soil metagenome]
MRKQVIAFDLDDTLAVTKSPISDEMSERLRELLVKFEVCVISGGAFEQFKKQVIDRLDVGPLLLRKLHMMPTCGTRYFRYDEVTNEWVMQYAEDLSAEDKKKILAVLEEGAKELGYWVEHPAGDIIEDRGSQITYSALGQKALAEDKYAWDEDGVKKQKLRAYAAERLPDFEVRAGGTTSVDVTTLGIDKAYGMEKLIQLLEISKDDVLFFGDKLEEGGNDYPVKAMGIDCIAVERWEETALALEAIIKVS